MFIVLCADSLLIGTLRDISRIPLLGFLILLVAASDAAIGLSFLVRAYTSHKTYSTYTFTKLSI
jgi:NADH:ubiquinone oxidoreductase subunit K